METFQQPWPFTGREDEHDLIRRSLAAGRRGMVITGAAGCGKTRLALEATRGTGCATVTGTPAGQSNPLAAFAHLLPDTASVHQAVRMLRSVRVLLVDDAHLLDDTSAALVHQLAVCGSTRLLVAVSDRMPVPGAVSRLWSGELLTRLRLMPLPREATAHLMAADLGGPVERLTANRLHCMCQGELRLLRELLGTLRERGLLSRVGGEWAWRGPVPVTEAVRERSKSVLEDRSPDGLAALTELAFGKPLNAGRLDQRVLERLETEGLIGVDATSAVRLSHPLHGPVLRARAGRLHAGRLMHTASRYAASPAAECIALAKRMAQADVREVPAGMGERLALERPWPGNSGAGGSSLGGLGADRPGAPGPGAGCPVPAKYYASRARFARLRGELRETLAWAREGCRHAPGDPACRSELALASAQLGDMATAREALEGQPAPGSAHTWLLAAEGDIAAAVHSVAGSCVFALHDAVRLGAPAVVADRLARLSGQAAALLAGHAHALARQDGSALDRAAGLLEQRGLVLFAAEACAQAAEAHRDAREARLSRARALMLARRCQGARTPALGGVSLGVLTARQWQIVSLAAAGMSNRQIAERLTLSVRTVGNHLYGAYTRLGGSDRAALPALLDAPDKRGDAASRIADRDLSQAAPHAANAYPVA